MAIPNNPIALAVGFEMKLYSRADVSTWVDNQVARVDVVVGPLLELTTLRDKDDGDIANLLCAMTGRAGEAEVGQLGLGIVHHLFVTKRVSLLAAVDRIRWLRMKHFSNDDAEYTECLVLDDAYDLAADGSYGTFADVERDMLAFLEPYAARLDGPER